MKLFKNMIQTLRLALLLIITQLMFAQVVLAERVEMVDGVLVNTQTGGGIDNTFNMLFDIATTIVSGITGILSIVMVFIFTWKAFQFARTGDNPSERARSINGLIFFFIGAASFGAASLITGIFSGMLLGI